MSPLRYRFTQDRSYNWNTGTKSNYLAQQLRYLSKRNLTETQVIFKLDLKRWIIPIFTIRYRLKIHRFTGKGFVGPFYAGNIETWNQLVEIGLIFGDEKAVFFCNLLWRRKNRSNDSFSSHSVRIFEIHKKIVKSKR